MPFSSYCIIIIINKKEGLFSRRCFFLSVQSLHPGFKKTALKKKTEKKQLPVPVPGARVAANPRLLCCKHLTSRKCGRKRGFGRGPMQACLQQVAWVRAPPMTRCHLILYRRTTMWICFVSVCAGAFTDNIIQKP